MQLGPRPPGSNQGPEHSISVPAVTLMACCPLVRHALFTFYFSRTLRSRAVQPPAYLPIGVEDGLLLLGIDVHELEGLPYGHMVGTWQHAVHVSGGVGHVPRHRACSCASNALGRQ